MDSPIVFLTFALVLATAAYLWFSGLGSVLFLWPFGVRPMFPFGARTERIFGMNPDTCDVQAFREKHDALLTQAQASRLRTFNTRVLGKHFLLSMRSILARIAARPRKGFSASLNATLELLADQLTLATPAPLYLAMAQHWRGILAIKTEKPPLNTLVAAYKTTLSHVKGSEKATELVINAMARACLELDYDYVYEET